MALKRNKVDCEPRHRSAVEQHRLGRQAFLAQAMREEDAAWLDAQHGYRVSSLIPWEQMPAHSKSHYLRMADIALRFQEGAPVGTGSPQYKQYEEEHRCRVEKQEAGVAGRVDEWQGARESQLEVGSAKVSGTRAVGRSPAKPATKSPPLKRT